MRMFESGGALIIEPGRQMWALMAAFALGAAAIALPSLFGIYLLVIA